VAGVLEHAFLILVGVLFVITGSVFVAVQLPREVRELEEGAGAAGPPLATRQRFNVGLVMFVSQALQILVVSLAIGAFFVVFGALAVGPDVSGGVAWLAKPAEMARTPLSKDAGSGQGFAWPRPRTPESGVLAPQVAW
jgi:hypothetical protein